MRLLTSMTLMALPSLLLGQIAQTLIHPAGASRNWITVPSEEAVAPGQFFARFGEQLGLSSSDEMQRTEVRPDDLGMEHHRFEQYHSGVPVEGAQFILHSQGTTVKKANGRLVSNITGSAQAAVSSVEAITVAKRRISANSYLWESEAAEQQLKRIRDNSSATYFPKPELVWFDKHYSQDGSNYILAWKIELNTMDPLGRHDVFINASTGEVAHVISKSGHTDVPGTAQTKYSGTQNILTDSVSPTQFRLRESSRGNGIETYDLNESIDYGDAVDFLDTDNLWNNVNAQQDEAATDAHWGMEMTYDYYMQKFNRNSLNDSGMVMISYLHYDQDYSNAFWNGSFMTFGDGSGNLTAFTALDVVGHEATHGVTEFSAQLLYQDESGALNESFSDIFGEAIQFWATPALGDWLVGADIGPALRSMSNPKQYGDPGTYLGTNWATGPFDNGGVHTNSGVQNHWFYILSAGDTGMNDFGHLYAVEGLGIDTAAAIAYRNLTTYLTMSSTYEDARLGAIQSAEDLYGPCSHEVVQTSAAWFAVGMGYTIQDNDLWTVDLISPVSACGLSNAEVVTARLRYNGCAVPINAGDTIPMAFRVDGGATILDTLFLSSPVNGGDTITFTFNQTANLSIVGVHTIDVWSGFSADPQRLNDTLLAVEVTHILQQNVDMGVVGIISPISSCHLSALESVEVELQFFGCDSLPAGSIIPLGYRVDGGSAITSNFVLPQTVYPGISFPGSITGTSNLSAHRVYTIDAWTAFAPDFLNGNDTLFGNKVEKPYEVAGKWIRFEQAIAVKDSFYEITGVQAEAKTHSSAASTGNLGLRMTGGDVLSALDSIDGIPDGTNNFDLNHAFGAKVCFCVDASGWSSAYLRFDLKQVFSPLYELYLGDPISDASSFRVLVNNNQVGPIYTPTTTIADPFVTHHVDLNSHAGSYFELCFETRCFFNPAFDPTAPLGQGDQAKVDNVIVSRFPVGVDEPTSIHIGLYPNPSDGRFEVMVDQSFEGALEVVDVLGRRIWFGEINDSRVSIALPAASSGVFFVKVLDIAGHVTATMPLVIE